MAGFLYNPLGIFRYLIIYQKDDFSKGKLPLFFPYFQPFFYPFHQGKS